MINSLPIPLSSARQGIEYTVSQISQSPIKSRLYDMGITENCNITKLFDSPFGTPCAYLARGTLIALRKSDAQKIAVHRHE